mgnify:CR=1 FL=1
MQLYAPASPAFHKFTRWVLFVAVLLIWWGAATTTKQAGMAFADWPLSLGSINPPGWLRYMVPFLEHSHRLLATVVGLMTLALFSWTYVRRTGRWWEVLILVIVLAIVFGTYISAGAEKESAESKQRHFYTAFVLSLIPIAWLAWSWWRRNWTPLEKLSGLALLMVTAQAIFGGLRVTEISNTFAVIHGCVAQGFFCVLLLISLMASPKWERIRFFNGKKGMQVGAGFVLTLLVSLQLIFGASMRHFHRSGLADQGMLKTQGTWIPSFDEPIITVMFFHKLTAFLIFFAVVAACFLFRGLQAGRYLRWLLALIFVQIGLGLSVIATGKHFWLTNFHVLSGLAILALSFTFLVKSIRSENQSLQ